MKIKTNSNHSTAAASKVVVKKHLWTIPDLVHLATNLGWTTVGLYPETSVICFCRGNDRISYYYETGVLACCLNHPTSGKVQLFCKRPEVERFFRHPPDSAMAAKNIVCRLGNGEFGQAEPVLGNRRWWACSELGDQLGEKGADVDKTTVVALGKTWFTASCFGRYTFGDRSMIPKSLDNKLHGRQHWRPHVEIFAFGPEDGSHFIQFVDGKQTWEGIPHDLVVALNMKGDTEVQTLALGRKDSYFCLWTDGTTKWNNLSLKMHKALSGNRDAKVEEVTMGPKGEYFIRFDNGEWKVGAHPRFCDMAIQKIEEEKQKRIVHIAFGHNETWLVTYE